jgi:hypothetical protein
LDLLAADEVAALDVVDRRHLLLQLHQLQLNVIQAVSLLPLER